MIHLAIVSMSNLKCTLFGLEIIQNIFNDLTLFFIAMQPVRYNVIHIDSHIYHNIRFQFFADERTVSTSK